MEIIPQFRLIVGSQAINAQLKILLISLTVPIEYGRALKRGSGVYLYRIEYRFFNRSPRRHRHACDHASGENKLCRLVNKYGQLPHGNDSPSRKYSAVSFGCQSQYRAGHYASNIYGDLFALLPNCMKSLGGLKFKDIIQQFHFVVESQANNAQFKILSTVLTVRLEYDRALHRDQVCIVIG